MVRRRLRSRRPGDRLVRRRTATRPPWQPIARGNRRRPRGRREAARTAAEIHPQDTVHIVNIVPRPGPGRRGATLRGGGTEITVRGSGQMTPIFPELAGGGGPPPKAGVEGR